MEIINKNFPAGIIALYTQFENDLYIISMKYVLSHEYIKICIIRERMHY